jgi:subtilisin family serine protease
MTTRMTTRRISRMHSPRTRRAGFAFAAVLSLVAGLLTLSAGRSTPAAAQDTAAVPVAPAVTSEIDKSGRADFMIVMDGKADLAAAAAVDGWVARGDAVVSALRTVADRAQAGLRAELSRAHVSFTPYWVTNAILVRDGDQATLDTVSRRAEVRRINAVRTVSLPPVREVAPAPAADAPEWGVARIGADRVRQEWGYDGAGVVVANIDTGVNHTHPALAGSYRGNRGDGTFDHSYNWFDPTGRCGSAPCDDLGHGTHTMGTMVGDGGPGNRIGVAPGARWIAAKACVATNGGECHETDLLAAAQWLLAPTDASGRNPDPGKRPNVVNNSWSGGQGDSWFADAVTAWRAAGIFPVFSAGNSGPACGTANSPGDQADVYAVGAFEISGVIAPFSSRGPSVSGLTKPDIAAPGRGVRSSTPGGAYEFMSGTSMAAPHVAGTVALLLSAAPRLVGDLAGITASLDGSAVDVEEPRCGGTVADNNTWGQGKLDAYAAVSRSPHGPVGTIAATVTGADTQAPIAGARISVTGAAGTRELTTDAMGRLRIFAAPGDYRVQVSSYGYAKVERNITVTADVGTAVDTVLSVGPGFHDVTGTVTVAGAPVARATVAVSGEPYDAAVTGADGRFLVRRVSGGEHATVVRYSGCAETRTVNLVVDGPRDLPVDLTRRTDGYGHTCDAVAPVDITATTAVPVTTGKFGLLDLPFPVGMYGTRYQHAFVGGGGVLSFVNDPANFSMQGSLPSTAGPDAVVAPFWLTSYGGGSVRTAVSGQAPDRRFVVRWSGLRDGDTAGMDAAAVFGEDGTLTYQYERPSPAAWTGGADAVVGIENEAGDDGFLLSKREALLTNTAAIRISGPPAGAVRGTVTDRADGSPIAGARVEARVGDRVTESTYTAEDGAYTLTPRPGAYTVRATATNQEPATTEVDVPAPGRTVRADLTMTGGRLALSTAAVEQVVPAGERRTAGVRLTNTGDRPVHWRARDQIGGAPLRPLQTWRLTNVRYAYEIEQVGDRIWVGNAGGESVEYTMDGLETGRRWRLPFSAANIVGLVHDTRDGTLCRNVREAKAQATWEIVCFDPSTGALRTRLPVPADLTGTVTGLAHDAATDTFWLANGATGRVYRVAGPSHSSPGRLLGHCALPAGGGDDMDIDPADGSLWVLLHDSLYQVDLATCQVRTVLRWRIDDYATEILSGLDVLGSGEFLLLDNRGYRVHRTTGPGGLGDVGWLGLPVSGGTLDPGQSATLTADVNAANLTTGVHNGGLTVFSDTAAGRTSVPVRAIVPATQVGVDAGATTGRRDKQNDAWQADKAYTAGGWGYLYQGAPVATAVPIAGTEDDQLYQNARGGQVWYRFDNLPNGVYEVDVRLAEIQGATPGRRRFDLVANSTRLLAGYDVAAAVGQNTASDQRFFVRVTGGRLDVRMIPLAGSLPPSLNALRVTHRPDRS